MRRPPAHRALIVAVAIAAGLLSLPLFAQQAGLTLEGLSTRIDVLFSGQQYLTHRIAALETAVASQRQVAEVPSETPTPTPIPTQAIPTATSTPIPTSSPIPTETATAAPSATPTEESATITADRRLSLRRGPGNNHSIITYVERNSLLEVMGKNLAGSWIQVSYDDEVGWLPSRYANDLDDIPIVATPTPLPSPTPADTATPVPTPTIERVTEDLWDRLKEVARKDSEAAQPDKVMSQDEISATLTNYFTVLTQLREPCDMSRMELIDLIEPQGQRIDDAGISVKTGYWARWSLLSGMREYLSENEVDDCADYVKEYATWVIVKYGAEE